MNQIELLAPAGGMEQMKAACRFGADAVYGGLPRFGLRAFADNFNENNFAEAVSFMHDAGKKFYITLNLLPSDTDMEGFLEVAEFAHKAGVDAAIVSDLGAMSMIHQKIPDLPLHVSTQANVLNSFTANHLHQTLGVERIVLSRELDFDSIAKFRQNIPDSLELEAFVHGAMCMAYSGRCLLSNALSGRSGNRGACSQPCRWKYHVVEEKRPGEYLPIFEDEEGTHLFSAYDLCMLDYLPEMVKSGITSFKIEGRMKTAYYVASVISVYRHALDLLAKSENDFYAALPNLKIELDKASHRKSNTGFYFGQPLPVAGADGFLQSMQYVGDVVQAATEDKPAVVRLKNRFFVGDPLEVLTPNGSIPFTATEITLVDTLEKVEKVTVAGTLLYLPMPEGSMPGDLLRGPNPKLKKQQG